VQANARVALRGVAMLGWASVLSPERGICKASSS
jgi:hypothetical protein